MELSLELILGIASFSLFIATYIISQPFKVSLEDIKQSMKDSRQTMQEIRLTLEGFRKDVSSLSSELAVLGRDLKTAFTYIDELKQERSKLLDTIADLQRNLVALENRLSHLENKE